MSEINLSIIGAHLETLDRLCREKRKSNQDFREAVKAVAQESRCEASVLAKFVNSRVGETSDRQAMVAEQTAFLFDNLGV